MSRATTLQGHRSMSSSSSFSTVDGHGQDHRGEATMIRRTKTTTSPTTAAQWLRQMSIEEKIGQMSQIDVGMLMKEISETRDDSTTDPIKVLDINAVKRWIGEMGIGSILNFANPTWTAAEYRQAVSVIQEVARNYSRPPVIWGLDSVHGANYIHGATIPPQPINMAASFNTTVAFLAGRMASRDTRAAGISWLFSPLLGVALEPRWSRVYETFGEDPVLVGAMAAQMVRGIQRIDPDPTTVPSRAAACAKHFVGYSFPHNGHDRSPSWIPTRHLYQYFVPPWKKVMNLANQQQYNDDSNNNENIDPNEPLQVLTVMESYTETDGVPQVANRNSLNYLLRQRLQFNGVLVTDYEEMRNLHNWHHVANNDSSAIQQSLREGSVDMSMIPWDPDGFQTAILTGLNHNHRLSVERIDQSAERVLNLKEQLNMMTEIIHPTNDTNLDRVGSDHLVGLEMARESIILVKNDGLLPFHAASPTGTTSAGKRPHILVTGPTATSLIFQSGGWTGQWQGAPNQEDYFTYGSTVLGAFSAVPDWDVSYSCGVNVLGDECEDSDASTSSGSVVEQIASWVGLGPEDSIARAVAAAQKSVDLVVVCVGEEAYTEKPGDIRSLSLPENQYTLVRELREKGNANILLVYFGGRPRLLGDMVDHASAVLLGFLPGPSAGEAIVDLVTGKVNPSARLPITYPRYDDGGGISYYHTLSDQCTKGDGPLPHYEYVPCEVQWSFGYGLSYTKFEYSDFTADGGIDRDLQVVVTVKNTGTVGGAEVVMFFTFDDFRSTTPEFKRLRVFEKVYLLPGEQITVEKRVPLDELAFVGPHDDHHYIIDPTMTSVVGVGATTNCREEDAAETNPLCLPLQAKEPNQPYVGACETACDLWMNSGCATAFGLHDTKSCLDMCVPISSYPNSLMDGNNDGWGWSYVDCLESVVAQGQQKHGNQCSLMTTLCRDIFQTENLDEFGLGGFGGTGTSRHGPTQNGQHVPPSNFVAILTGLLTSFMIVYVLYGGTFDFLRRPKEEEDIMHYDDDRDNNEEREEEMTSLRLTT